MDWEGELVVSPAAENTLACTLVGSVKYSTKEEVGISEVTPEGGKEFLPAAKSLLPR